MLTSTILLKRATIHDVRSSHHAKRVDVLISDGSIQRISKEIKASDQVETWSSPDLHISPGWLDIGTYNGDPGHEYREDLQSLAAAAQQGGYYALAPFPPDTPAIDHIGQLAYLKARAEQLPIRIYPIAHASMRGEGRDLSEILDLSHAGAIAFSDGDQACLRPDQLRRTLEYLKMTHKKMIISASEMSTGLVHEGSTSVIMGLEGAPEHLETQRIEAILSECDYTGAPAILYNISTPLHKAPRLKKSKHLTSTVSAMHLIHDADEVAQFNLNLKVSPPLRDSSTRRSLIKSVESGDINVITSHHRPLSVEEKDQPFGISEFGASTLDTVFSSLHTLSDGLSLDRLTHCLSIGPHEALDIPCPLIETGSPVCLTVFDPTEPITYISSMLGSRSKNNPYLGLSLKGKVIGTLHGSTSFKVS